MTRLRQLPRPRRPWVLGLSLVVAVLALLPLVFLVLQARQAGWAEVHRVLFRHLSVELLRNTVELAIIVTAACAVIGVATAWCIERTALPGRRIWAVLVVLPASVPDFVVGYAWHSFAPSLNGLRGAAVVMTLDLYPLVYLPVAAALRRVDPALEETALSLGDSPWRVFRRVTLRQIQPALLGGSLVIVLALLAEFGAFEILDFRTFTTEVFTELSIDQPAASALALVLVGLGLFVLLGEGLVGGTRVARTAGGAARPPLRRPLGRAFFPVLGLLGALVILALGVPLGTLGYWLSRSQHTTLPSSTTLGAATFATVRYAAAAAAIATVAALPVALLGQTRTRFGRVLERSTLVIQSVPGVVVALTLVFFAIRYANRTYQTGGLMVAAYALLFFPLALIALRGSVAQASPRLAEMGRSLGRPPILVLLRVTVPLVAPGLAAAFSLVFLSAVTELTATLVLVPTGVHTLATQFWAYQTNAAYGAAAPFAAVIVAIAAIPSVILGTWFAKRTGAT